MNRHDANWESAQPGALIAQMAGIFRRRRRVTKSTVAVTEAHADAPTGRALRFEPLGRGAVPPAWYWSRVIESVSRPERHNAEERSAPEVAALREELKREQADKERALAEAERQLDEALAEQRSELEEEKTRALAEAERQLVKALAEQRAEMEEEAHGRLAEVARLRDDLACNRDEIEGELAAIRRLRSQTDPELAAIVRSAPNAHR